MNKMIFTFLLICISFAAISKENYRVSLLRATPGSLNELILQVKEYKTSKTNQVTIMRHSQGDHWDIMLLEPAGKTPLIYKRFESLADFQHTFLASSSTNWKKLKVLESMAGLFHIEMFNARHGKANELLKQRKMENNYLTSTKRKANIIFKTEFGNDVDSFTIGYYKDLVEFATMPNLPEQVFTKAAVEAGFKSRDDIGLYLRELIVSHQDTLATKIQ